jgi:hypothetical protein
MRGGVHCKFTRLLFFCSYPGGIRITAAINAGPQMPFVSSAPFVTLTRPSFSIISNSTLVAGDGSILAAFIGGTANVSWIPTPYSQFPQSTPTSTNVELRMRTFNVNGASMAQAMMTPAVQDPAMVSIVRLVRASRFSLTAHTFFSESLPRSWQRSIRI